MLIALVSFASAEDESVGSGTVSDLRLMRFNEAFSDFFFNIQSFFTFSDDAKLGLFESRVKILEERQALWARAMPMNYEENVSRFVSDSWSKVQRDILDVNSKIMVMGEMAKVKDDRRLQERVREILRRINSTSVNVGVALALNESVFIVNDSFSGVENKSKMSISSIHAGNKSLTLDEAKMLVEDRIGIAATDAKVESVGNLSVYVIRGFREEAGNESMSVKEYEVKVRSDNGEIVSSALKSSSESRSDDGYAKAEGDAKASGDSTEVSIETETTSSGSSVSSTSVAKARSSSK